MPASQDSPDPQTAPVPPDSQASPVPADSRSPSATPAPTSTTSATTGSTRSTRSDSLTSSPPPVPADSLSRRALLALTATATAAACAPPPAPATATFVGQDPAQAHRLRDASFPKGPVQKDISTAVAIVGGGVAGLAAAWRLRRAGLADVHLVELEPELGGTARAGQLPRSQHPLGAHYLPSPPPECRALELLLEDLGILVGRDAAGRAEYAPSAIVSAPIERHQSGLLWDEGLYPQRDETADEAAQWTRLRDQLRDLDRRRVGARDGRRLFALPVARSSDELRHLDRVSLARMCDELDLGSWRLRWALDYACLDDYGCTSAQVSAFAAYHHFLARGLEEARDGATLSWPEGNARLVRGMAGRADLGDRLHLGTAVTAVDPDAGDLTLHTLATGETTRLRARQILWAAPRFVLPRVLPPGRDPLPPGALTYAPWLVASVELRARPRGVGAPLSWDNVPIAGPGLGYVVATHAEPLPSGGCVVTYYEPLPGDDPATLSAQRTRLLTHDLDHWAAHVRAALSAMHPGIEREIVHINVTRWGHAMIRPVPGLLFGGALDLARAPIARVRPCAADTTGLPLFEEAFYSGVLAAEAALAELGRVDPSIVEA
jgi:phytoene dehydrogenase-like protein